MKKASEAVKGAAREFVAALRPEDRLAVLTFADGIVVAHALGVTREWSLEAIDRYVAEGGTALYDALFGSIHVVREAEGRRAIVVLTDGRDENNPGTAPGSVRTYTEILKLLREVDVAVFPVGLGTKTDPGVLEDLARLSGGQPYFPSDVTHLGEEYAKIIENLSRRWVISYTSTNSTRDGAWREVEIRTRTGRARVTSRPGYYAPDR
jgi:VWFA-related protein